MWAVWAISTARPGHHPPHCPCPQQGEGPPQQPQVRQDWISWAAAYQIHCSLEKPPCQAAFPQGLPESKDGPRPREPAWGREGFPRLRAG